MRRWLVLFSVFFACGDPPPPSSVCGNGTTETGEECDDANQFDTDACLSDCTAATCGDGAVQTGIEECDDGNTTALDGCSDICNLEFCGDNVVNGSTPEQCDDGNQINTDDCLSDCQNARCGDGFIQIGVETCDDGNTTALDGCNAQCQDEFCGDGLDNDGNNEACDDGNAIDTDGCRNSCQLADCGDGVVQDGVEECDDGNNIGTDACTVLCTNAICGDGFTQAGVEDCDDTNNIDTDACLSDCTFASCGDGFIQSGIEDCDDGNANDNDGCSAACRIEFCGDALTNNTVDLNADGDTLDAGESEQCDDGNTVNNDGCNADCQSTRVVQLVAGNAHTCALLNTGDVRCWGLATNGRLGYGDLINIGDNEYPRDVGIVDVGGVVTQLAAGNEHTCALLNTGNVRCWGRNNVGQLGYSDLVDIGDDETPASKGDVNIGGTVVQITAGIAHNCALLNTGNVRCWGNGANGRLGYANVNNIGDDETPASAGDVTVGGAVAQIEAGNVHTCAILTTNTVRCWGNGGSGRLGYGNTNSIGDNETPATAGDVNIGAGTPTQIQAASQHTCVRFSNNAVRCWGNGAGGRLGYGNVTVIGDDETAGTGGNVPGGNALEISAFLDHTCIRNANNFVRCWGLGANGRLGYANINDIGDDETPSVIGNVPLGSAITQIAVGAAHSCAILTNGDVRCWGNSGNGRLGYANNLSIGDDEAPSTTGEVFVGGLVAQLSANGAHTCALLTNGNVRCWGLASSGELGYGNTTTIGDNEAPTIAGDVNLGATATQIVTGAQHSCALVTGGNAICWGLGLNGALGYGNTNNIGDNELPSVAGTVNVGATIAQLAAGNDHTCALLTNGNVRCWGLGLAGRLGYGNTNNIGDDETPASAGNVNVGGTVVQITAGESHTCARLNDGNIRCWGNALLGRLGYGNTNNIGDDETPASAGSIDLGATALQIEAGDLHNCAIVTGGAVRCWGFNGDGELGLGNTINIGDNEAPSAVGVLSLGGNVAAISAGAAHSCALLDDDSLRCWGFSGGGRLGYKNNDTIGDNESPDTAGAVQLGGSAIQITTGGDNTCAVLDTGAVRCFGGNGSGQLGYSNRLNVGDDELPRDVTRVLVF
jgi:cysteine-rich repeat protein